MQNLGIFFSLVMERSCTCLKRHEGAKSCPRSIHFLDTWFYWATQDSSDNFVQDKPRRALALMQRNAHLGETCSKVWYRTAVVDMRPCPLPLSLARFGVFQVVLSHCPTLPSRFSSMCQARSTFSTRTRPVGGKAWQNDRNNRLTPYTEISCPVFGALF